MKRLVETTAASATALSSQHSRWHFDMEANKNQPPSEVVLEVTFDEENQPVYDLAIDDGTPPPAPALQSDANGVRSIDRTLLTRAQVKSLPRYSGCATSCPSRHAPSFLVPTRGILLRLLQRATELLRALTTTKKLTRTFLSTYRRR